MSALLFNIVFIFGWILFISFNSVYTVSLVVSLIFCINLYIYGYIVIFVGWIPWVEIVLFSIALLFFFSCIGIENGVLEFSFLLTFIVYLVFLFLFGNLFVFYCIYEVPNLQIVFLFLFNFFFLGFVIHLLNYTVFFYLLCICVELIFLFVCYSFCTFSLIIYFLIFFFFMCMLGFLLYFYFNFS